MGLWGGGWVLGSVRAERTAGGRERAQGPGGGRMVVVMLEDGGGGIREVKDAAGLNLSGVLWGEMGGVRPEP